MKEELNCSGCKSGPGRALTDGCKLAECCRTKGHDQCTTCEFKSGCGLLRGRHQEPEHRKQRIQDEQENREALAKRSVGLGKWLWILFWLVVPATVASLLKTDFVKNISPDVYRFGRIMGIVMSLLYGCILLRLSYATDRYRKAGIYLLISVGVAVATLLISDNDLEYLSVLLALAAAVISLVGEYNEYQGHATVLVGADNALSQKWEELWKWYIRCMLAIIGSVLLVLIFPLIGALLALAGSLGLIVIEILKLVYLYQTANVFRRFSA
jgi:hypothetical protein